MPYSLAALILLLLHLLTNSAALPGYLGVGPASAWVVVPFAIGATVRVTRESADRARAEAVQQRVDDERLWAAQEVHDIVGHGLAAIKMQADVALHLLAKRPEQAEAALDAISRSSREALDELRATLAVVRRTGTDTERSPGPSLARLGELRRRMSEAGLHVHLETVGEPRTLSAAVDLTGYRVVQESLTNVLRHSAGDRFEVRASLPTEGQM
jgi:signal transduction histidine kinase